MLLAAACLGCREQAPTTLFPSAGRDVAPIVSNSFSTEDARDRTGEADKVMALARVERGMSVADIGAGEGYYTVRLAPLVGRGGRVLAEDIVPATVDRLAERVQREQLDNVAVRLGTADDPRLPPLSFDRIFLVHVYHEVRSPYAFLWHLREGLKPGGELIVVDGDRPVRRHGIAPALLRCELAAVGLELARLVPVNGEGIYLASFLAAHPRPAPNRIRPCRLPQG